MQLFTTALRWRPTHPTRTHPYHTHSLWESSHTKSYSIHGSLIYKQSPSFLVCIQTHTEIAIVHTLSDRQSKSNRFRLAQAHCFTVLWIKLQPYSRKRFIECRKKFAQNIRHFYISSLMFVTSRENIRSFYSLRMLGTWVQFNAYI